MAKLSRDDVLKLAALARLDLNDNEIEEFTGELGEILAYVAQLQQAEVSGLEATTQVTGLKNVTRNDEVRDYGYQPTDLLRNVPEVEDNQIKVKRVL